MVLPLLYDRIGTTFSLFRINAHAMTSNRWAASTDRLERRANNGFQLFGHLARHQGRQVHWVMPIQYLMLKNFNRPMETDMNDKDKERAERVFPQQSDRYEKGSAMTLIQEASVAQKAKSARLRAERMARDARESEALAAAKPKKRVKKAVAKA
ncbi:MAG: hypothetical protein KAG89_00635 [Fulvimarina manganoxydans]|nr:hypothetical protein [Fulvimarina manganoxydans]